MGKAEHMKGIGSLDISREMEQLPGRVDKYTLENIRMIPRQAMER